MLTREQALDEALKIVRKKIAQIHEHPEDIGEENTKAALIEPILAALGWDIHNIDEVRREYRWKPQDNPVDYALLINRTPSLFIEAKSLGKDLSDRKWISQIISYAAVTGIEWCVLTNGDEYRIYNAHAPVEVEQKLFRTVCVSIESRDGGIRDTLLLLSKENMQENRIKTLWRAQFIDCQVRSALNQLFGGPDESFVRLIRKYTTELEPSDIRDSLKRGRFRIDFPIMPMENLGGKARTVQEQPEKEVEPIDLIRAGLVHPPMTIEHNFRESQVEATIQEDGKIIFDGKEYESLTGAGLAAQKSMINKEPGRHTAHISGWVFWKYREPQTGQVVRIDTLRQRYLKQFHHPG